VQKNVTGGNPNINTVLIDNATSIEKGMIVTGPGITGTDHSPIVFDGNTYYALPMDLSDLAINSEGVQNRPTLTIANVESILRQSSIFQNADDGGTGGIANFTLDHLIGKRVTKRQTLEKYLSIKPGAVSTKAVVEFPKRTYIIDSIKQKTSDMVVFELANPFDLQGILLPGRQVVGKYCPWAYQGLSYTKPIGACSWTENSKIIIDDEGTERKYHAFFTELDEPIIWKYLIHNSNSAQSILSGKAYTSGASYAKNALVAYTIDSGTSYTYWRSEVASNTSVPSTSNSSWQAIRLYEPFVAGVEYSTHPTDPNRNDYVIHPVTNASGKTDTTFTILDSTTVYRVSITNNSVTPDGDSAYWTKADSCGKILNSCKIRYQFKSAGGTNSSDHRTIPLVDLDTKHALPYGGFPGSRKI
jgi:lambda family phage minor tail protein L